MFQPVEMPGAGEPERTHLLNLSASGAMLHRANPPGVGSIVRLVDAVDIWRARVRWVGRHRFGAEFATPLTDDLVLEVLARRRDLVAGAAQRIGVLA